jgi:LysM repeat protein/uncharacterized membrane protein
MNETTKIYVDGIEYLVQDGKSLSSSDIAFASFSGYVSFIGQVTEESAKFFGDAGTKLIGKRVNTIFSIVDGVVTGAFDHNMNPDKELEEIIGARVVEYAFAKIGAMAGGIIFGPPGAVGGAVIGSIFGSLYSEDVIESFLSINTEHDLEILTAKIRGTKTQEEVYIEELTGDVDFCKKIYYKYLNYQQINTITQKFTVSVKDLLLSFDNQTKTSEIETLDEEIVKEITESILEKKDIKQISINNETYNIVKEGNLIVRNAIEHIPTVSFLLSNILIRANEILDVGEHGLYKVNSGDTMSEIAQSFGFTNALTLCA